MTHENYQATTKISNPKLEDNTSGITFFQISIISNKNIKVYLLHDCGFYFYFW